MLLWVFLTSATLLVFHYLAYPALLIAMSRRVATGSRSAGDQGEQLLPSLTVVIAACNEARVIAGKLDNTLSLNYPSDRLHVIVAAQGSSDATADIASRYGRNVKVLHEEVRRGKAAALNQAVASASTDIIVFSDANNLFDADALIHLVRRLKDPRVGGVSGCKSINTASDREAARGDGLYWRYDSAIKLAESRLGSVSSADADIFAIRRVLYRPLDEALINDDGAITLQLVRAGYRVLYEPAARSSEEASITLEDDFRVKVRVVAGGLQTLGRNWWYLMPPRHAFAFRYFARKFLRWFSPELLLLMLISSFLLAPTHSMMLTLSLLQCGVYALAALAWLGRRRTELPAPAYFALYFVTMNVAAMVGQYRYLTRTTRWTQAAR